MHAIKALLSFVLGASTLLLNAQALTFSPEKPIAGETISLQYAKNGSVLEKAPGLYVTAYSIVADKITAYDVQTTETEGVLRGNFVVPANAQAIYFAVKNWQGDNDNNDGFGWGTAVYQPGRQNPVNGYGISRASALSIHASSIGMEMDLEETGRLLGKNFEELKGNQQLMLIYAVVASRTENAEALKQVGDFASQLGAKKKASEDEWMLAFEISQMLENEDLMASIRAKIEKKYPQGRLNWQEKCQAFLENEFPVLDEQKKNFEALAASPVAKTKEGMETISRMAAALAALCFSEKDWAGFEKFSAKISSPFEKASLFNNIAWNETGESLEGESGELEQAKKISSASLQLLEFMKSNPGSDEQLSAYSPSETVKILDNQKAMYADTYALILFKLGETEEALKVQLMACEQDQFRNSDYNERYCAYLEKTRGAQAAEAKLEELISLGFASPAMKEQYKRLYSQSHSAEQAADKFSKMESEALSQMKKALEEKMIDEVAPAFSLRNLSGETVSLESLKGKVVVIDFWATWCGPCVRSFPGMQRTLNAHLNRSDVVFLFIDTWERSSEKEKNASQFIESNNYTFNVLMDNDNEVVEQFGVKGIPAKFVLDRNGRIRFSSTGFNPDEDAMVQELTMMIELAGGQAR